jgi:hypothetical protein
MKLWIDDIRKAPYDYVWLRSTNEALRYIHQHHTDIEEISIDHDAGEFQYWGGDFIEVLKEMERLTRRYGTDFSHIKFFLHSANPVGVANMRAIIEKNSWKEIK